MDAASFAFSSTARMTVPVEGAFFDAMSSARVGIIDPPVQAVRTSG
jgi:hypothetical protein